MKLTKSKLKQFIKEELSKIITEVDLAPEIFKQLKASGNLPPDARIDFSKTHANAAAQPKQATPQAKASSKGGTPAIALSQALSGKIGQQATQFIMGKLTAVDVHALVKMLGSQK